MTDAILASAPPARARRSLSSRLLLAVGALILGFAGLELAARVRMYLKYGRATPEQYASSIDPVSGLRLPLPGQTIGAMHIDSLGFRGAEITRAKPKDTIRIACLGASTTFCAEVNDDRETWPERIATTLRAAYPDVRFEVVNSGIPGIGVEETRVDFVARVAALSPDVIVVYHATNDLSRDTRTLALERGLIDELPDHRSFLARHSVLVDLIEKNLQILSRQAAAAKSDQPRLDCDFGALATTFEKRLDALFGAAAETGAIVVFPTFSVQIRPEQTPERRIEAAVTSLYYMPYLSPEQLLVGFAAYNEAIRRATRRHGAILVEAEFAIPGDSGHFCDSVHFNAKGCEVFAGLVVAALQSDPRLARRVETVRASR